MLDRTLTKEGRTMNPFFALITPLSSTEPPAQPPGIPTHPIAMPLPPGNYPSQPI
jgi:hypothetical protein